MPFAPGRPRSGSNGSIKASVFHAMLARFACVSSAGTATTATPGGVSISGLGGSPMPYKKGPADTTDEQMWRTYGVSSAPSSPLAVSMRVGERVLSLNTDDGNRTAHTLSALDAVLATVPTLLMSGTNQRGGGGNGNGSNPSVHHGSFAPFSPPAHAGGGAASRGVCRRLELETGIRTPELLQLLMHTLTHSAQESEAIAAKALQLVMFVAADSSGEALRAMSGLSKEPATRKNASSASSTASSTDAATNTGGLERQIIRVVLHTMSCHSSSAAVQARGLWSLFHILAAVPPNNHPGRPVDYTQWLLRVVVVEGGLPLIFSALRQHAPSPEEAAARARSLSASTNEVSHEESVGHAARMLLARVSCSEEGNPRQQTHRRPHVKSSRTDGGRANPDGSIGAPSSTPVASSWGRRWLSSSSSSATSNSVGSKGGEGDGNRTSGFGPGSGGAAKSEDKSPPRHTSTFRSGGAGVDGAPVSAAPSDVTVSSTYYRRHLQRMSEKEFSDSSGSSTGTSSDSDSDSSVGSLAEGARCGGADVLGTPPCRKTQLPAAVSPDEQTTLTAGSLTIDASPSPLSRTATGAAMKQRRPPSVRRSLTDLLDGALREADAIEQELVATSSKPPPRPPPAEKVAGDRPRGQMQGKHGRRRRWTPRSIARTLLEHYDIDCSEKGRRKKNRKQVVNDENSMEGLNNHRNITAAEVMGEAEMEGKVCRSRRRALAKRGGDGGVDLLVLGRGKYSVVVAGTRVRESVKEGQRRAQPAWTNKSGGSHRSSRTRVRSVVKVATARRTAAGACDVAVKCVNTRRSTVDHVRAIATEVSILSQLQHSGVVRLADFLADERHGHCYIVTELVPGGNLRQRLARRGAYGNACGRAIARDILRAVAYCHSLGVAHRDLKLDNVLLVDPSGVGCRADGGALNNSGGASPAASRVKVADYGFARRMPAHIARGHGHWLHMKCGTNGFMAPEVWYSGQEGYPFGPGYGLPADMWSVGIIIYMLLTAEHPLPHLVNPQSGEAVASAPRGGGGALHAAAQRHPRCALSQSPSSSVAARPLAEVSATTEELQQASTTTTDDDFSTKPTLISDWGDSLSCVSAISTASSAQGGAIGVPSSSSCSSLLSTTTITSNARRPGTAADGFSRSDSTIISTSASTSTSTSPTASWRRQFERAAWQTGLDEEGPQLSAGARGLLARILCVDPQRRLTAQDALSHEWFAEADGVECDCPRWL